MIQSAPPPEVGVGTSLLVVIATLMPLLAVFLQFAVRFYSNTVGRDGAGKYGKEAVFGILLALAAAGGGGIQAGDIVKNNTTSESISGAVTSLQLAFVLILAATYFIGRDVVQAVSEDGEAVEVEADTEAKDTNSQEQKDEQHTEQSENDSEVTEE